MLNRIWNTFRFELRQNLRQKGFWVLAVAALWGSYSYFNVTRPSVGWDEVSAYHWEIQQSGIVFLNLSQMLPTFQRLGVLAAGVGLFVSLLTAGRTLKRPIENILYTKPISSFELQCGRFLALIVFLAGLSLMPVAAMTYFYSKYRYYAWQPMDFVYLWGLGIVWPMAFCASVAWWARHAFRNLILAATASLLIAALIGYIGGEGAVLLSALPQPFQAVFACLSSFWFLRTVPAYYHTPLGFSLPHQQWHCHLAISLSLAALFMLGSAYYLRRRIPNQPPAPEGRSRRLDTPMLRSLWHAMKPDCHAGWDNAIALAICAILLAAFGGHRLKEEQKAERLDQAWNQEWERIVQGYKKPISNEPIRTYIGPPPPEQVEIVQYDLDAEYRSRENQFRAECVLRMKCGEVKEVTPISFLLNPGLRVTEVLARDSGQPIEFEQTFNQVRVKLPVERSATESIGLTFRYEGNLFSHSIRTAQGRDFIERNSERPIWYLSEEDLFYPVLPREGAIRQRFFTARTRLRIPGDDGAIVLSPGQMEEDWRVASFPLTRLFFVCGPFRKIETSIAGVPIKLYALPGREGIAKVFLEDIGYLLRDTFDYFGSFPFPDLVLYDDLRPWGGPSGPGISPICLDALWRSKTTLDTFIRKFKRNVDKRQYFVYVGMNDAVRIQDFISDLCFRDSVHPTGNLSILLTDYLPSYMRQISSVGGKIANPYAYRGLFDVPQKQWRQHLPPLRRLLSESDPAKGAGRPRDAHVGDSPADRKALALFHMLHYLMGQDKFQQLFQAYLERYQFQEVHFADFRRMASEIAGEDLEWYFQLWLNHPALPIVGIARAQARMYDDPGTVGMDYEVTLDVVNDGTGEMQIPVYLKTEGDDILTPVRLGTGEKKEIRLKVPDRPLFASIDPVGWILQGEYVYDKDIRGRVMHPVEILESWRARLEPEPTPGG